MSDYAAIVKTEKHISVCLYNSDPKIMAIGGKMEEACPDAYMNGYNWEAFFNYYLKKHAPDILEEMSADPEADMYAAVYPLTAENENRADQFLKLMRDLIKNESELIRIVEEEGGEIEWD